jgi:Ca-activated chloride channel family protein
MRLFIKALLLVCMPGLAIAITPAQQKALNSYVEYANHSAGEVAQVVQSLMAYYPSLAKPSSWSMPRYSCPVQLEDYYLKNALTLSTALASQAAPLNARLNDLRAAAEKIDVQCKALDTYHKLGDYKQDNYAKAREIVTTVQSLVKDYQAKQTALQTALDAAYKKLVPSTGPYRQADDKLQAAMAQERALLDAWTFNLQQETHTGWPVEQLQQSIVATMTLVEDMKKISTGLKYPASSSWSNLMESWYTILEVKRRGWDEYNFDAQKSDAHSNKVYLDLINYYNGTLVSGYNSLLDYAAADGYRGLKAFAYFPRYDIRTQAVPPAVTIKPFQDAAVPPLAATPAATPMSRAVYTSLDRYIDYINETWRQTRYMQMVLTNLSSSADYYRKLESFERHGAMSFNYPDFTVPRSAHQQAMVASKALPPAVAATLNAEATQILTILQEMDALAATLQIDVQEKRYEKDRLARVTGILDREKELMKAWDQKKEKLYMDIRQTFNAWPQTNKTASWYVAGKALGDLADLDREALFQAKQHYDNETPVTISTTAIDASLRDVIAREYENMKGIEKIGRNNGNCPYTPYEDLPESSRKLSEELRKLAPAVDARREHPYYYMVYHYNDVVDDYNKFCDLSPDVLLLKKVKQPQLFLPRYAGQPLPDKRPARPPTTQVPANDATKIPEQNPPVKVTREPGQNTHTVQHDTVYIERRDTVYLSDAGEDIRSMEGYATNHMVLLLDVSGSMNQPGKLPLLKKSVLDLLSMMRVEDQVTIIAFSGKPKALLTAASFKEEEKIRAAVDELQSSGKTDGNAGLKLAYKLADQHYIRGGNNRILLATDGEFSVDSDVAALIDKFSREDIFLSIFNFGKGMGASKSLEKLATAGKGNYAAISAQNVDLKLIREVKAKKKK